MHLDLNGKVAIVTGAGRGIGLEIARTFAAEGAIVVIADLREDLLGEATSEWERNNWRGLQLQCDVSSAADCRKVAEAVEKEFGRIDILVNNAGVAGGGKVEVLAEDIWDRNFDINMKGTFLMCQAVVPAMKRQKSGRIINASSFAAIVPSIGGSAYAASKAAVAHFTRVLAGELGPFDITVNAYAPGMIPTEMNHFADAPPDRKEMLLNTLTLRRWGDAKDIANLLCFLSSEQAAYITGSLIDVSGGKYATQFPAQAYQ